MGSRTIALALALGAAPAPAQTTLYALHGEENALLGRELAAPGDLDGDGLGDLLVAASRPNGAGSIRAYSGATGLLLWTHENAIPASGIGIPLAALDDVDLDGRPDLATVRRSSEPESWTDFVEVRSGADGSLLYSVPPPSTGSPFQLTLARIGDLDGDGRGDFVVGHVWDASVPAIGAWFRSGVDGHVLHVATSSSPYGSAVAGLGDVDGDGIGDVAIGARSWPGGTAPQGRVDVLSGATFQLVWSAFGPTPQANLGASLAAVGDVDGDGVEDLLAGAFGFVQASTGAAYLLSGADGTILRSIAGHSYGDQLGFTVGRVGDLDGDGVPDLAAGSWVDNYARLHSGATGAELATLRLTDAAVLGPTYVLSPGDLDGDGRPEVVLASSADPDHAPYSGVVRVFSDPFVPATGASSCAGDGSSGVCPCGNAGAADAGCANALGIGARLAGLGTPSVAEDLFHVEVDQLTAYTLCVLFAGTQAGATAFAPAGDGLRCIAGSLRRVAFHDTNQAGRAWFGPTLSAAGGWAAGETRHFQVFYRSPSGPCGAGFNTTNAVSVAFGP